DDARPASRSGGPEGPRGHLRRAVRSRLAGPPRHVPLVARAAVGGRRQRDVSGHGTRGREAVCRQGRVVNGRTRVAIHGGIATLAASTAMGAVFADWGWFCPIVGAITVVVASS